MIDRAADVAAEHGQCVIRRSRHRSPTSERSDLDPSIDTDGVEQSAVVRDEDDRALEGFEGLLELLDRGEVEVVRRLVEHQAVHAASHQQGEHGPCAFTRRQRRRRATDVIGTKSELGEQRARSC